MKVIEVQNVFLKYPSSKYDTIRGITFDVRQGEIFGFLGPSGAGKSTMQKILTGTLRDYRGSVRVFGTEMKHRAHDYYEHIGVDFEFPNFYSKFTAMENLTYFASLYSRRTSDPLELLEKVGLQHDGYKKVSSYSKGMKMRLGFVRSLLHDPKLLFLDEPTSGLDPANARILKDMILEQKKMGKTILLTTHNMHDAEELCDRVAFIAGGTIKAIDTPHALRKCKADTKVEYRFLDNEKEKQNVCALSDLAHAEDFQAALQKGTLTSIHSKEQTLEDIFIELTGRGL
ncbi:ABC transporter ATP-binding protein [Qiania dongpingensis]|uniref:ABC transporter ATP-binding protein n=1 Tax=Qiania dongpingensis TaxID=2763669 RepID=A0A7G9G641_9FIRM|nr:ABC transporter ATP-binding protein [Qiania dongpingensis]QNM06273.1 ABC transporter ATP-binding protein [Qiania dongpingensis]